MRFPITKPLMVVCRVTGPNGRVRELGACLDPNSEYCYMLRNDAAPIGYPSVTFRPEDLEGIHAEEVVTVSGVRGIELGTMIKLSKVAVGKLEAKDVKAIVLKAEFPFLLPVSIFLGRSFLMHFRLVVDEKAGYFSLT